MSNYIPVEGNSGLYRDSNSTAIINKDKKAYLAYMERKKSMQNKNLELEQMKIKNFRNNIIISFFGVVIVFLLVF